MVFYEVEACGGLVEAKWQMETWYKWDAADTMDLWTTK